MSAFACNPSPETSLYNGVYGLIEEQRRMTVHIAEIVEQAVRETRAAAQPFWGPLRCMGVALPTKVSDKEALFPDRENELMHRIENLIDVPVVFENNVNCAAIAEGFCGNAVDEPFFVYIQIGIKIGMGIVLDGQLLRGRSGAAGEVSYLPFPWAPNQKCAPRRAGSLSWLGSDDGARKKRLVRKSQKRLTSPKNQESYSKWLKLAIPWPSAMLRPMQGK